MENRIFLKGILLGVILSLALPVWIRGSNIQPGNKKDTWSAWLSCSESCDGGLQSRARDVCPPELENTCTVIESRRCNEFSCDEIPSSSSPRSIVTTSLGTSAHAQKKFLTSSSSVPFTTRPGFERRLASMLRHRHDLACF
ncbi:uncharacterized protein LOC125646102 [Ostrea edulis]|uniref:uncharacterized protein LOC125646102 n=1 Tax=Ostrea edulis TaxID=37623 RepID=UPI0024AFCED8|nr:uncharacterized protein LOC125646102 [Ostrea edulis]